MVVRTPEQMAAFYEGREFPANAVRAVQQACFITFIVTNKQEKQSLLMEPASWRFLDQEGKIVKRLGRPYWDSLWQRLDMPPANRATFRWTQLPEQRDLFPGESVGGNVSIVPVKGPLKLTAYFRVGEGRDRISVSIEGLQCDK